MVMDILEKMPKWVIVATSVVLVALIGFIDYLSGDYSVLVFYALPVFLVAWFAGLWRSVFICFLVGATRFAADQAVLETEMVHAWNAGQDMVFLLVVAVLMVSLHKALE